MSRLPVNFFKFGASLTILALSGIYLLCDEEVAKGGIGVELYYAPMLDYILTTFIIFWVGMFLLDITEKEIFEVAELAVKSLQAISGDYNLHLSHVGKKHRR